jgi:hypothetical protein
MADEIVAKYKVDVSDASKNLDQLASKTENVEKETAKAAKGFKDLGNEAVGAVSMISPEIAQAASSFNTLKTGVLAMVGTLKTLRGALIATGLGALAVVLGSVAAYFASSEKAANRFKIIMAAIGQVIETVGNLFENLGEAIVDAFSNPKKALQDFSNGIKTYVTNQIDKVSNGVGLLGTALKQLFSGEFSKAFETAGKGIAQIGEGALMLNPAIGALVELGKGAKNLSAELQVSVAAAIKLQEAANKLAESDRALNVERDKSRAKIKELQLLAADTDEPINKRIAAAKEAATIEDALLAKRLRNGEEALRIAKEELRLTDDSTENRDKVAAAESNLANIREESAGKQRRLLMQIQAIENQVQAKAKAAADERAKIEADALAEREKIAAQELKYSEETAKERVKIAEDMAQMLLDIERYLARESNDILDLDLADNQRFYEKRVEEATKGIAELAKTEEESSAIFQAITDEKNQADLDAQAAHNARVLALNKAKLDAIREQEKEGAALTEEEKQQIFEASAQATVQLIGMVGTAIQDGYNQDLANLDRKLEQGLISEEQYQREKGRLMTKAANAAKVVAIFEAIINTAVAVTSASTAGPIIGPVLAALAAVLGAAQIAAIVAAPVPQFAKGVVDLQGEGTATSDSIHAKLSKGESVITAKETSKHKGLLEAMNKGLAEKYILSNYVKPALDSAMLSGFADMGKSAELNGLTANLKDHNIIAAMDRHRAADVAGFKMLAAKLDRRQPKRGGYE